MKRVIHAIAFLGLLGGGAVAVEKTAEACASYTQDADGNCTCRYFTDTGYNSCTQSGRACVLVDSGCGGGPGIQPF